MNTCCFVGCHGQGVVDNPADLAWEAYGHIAPDLFPPSPIRRLCVGHLLALLIMDPVARMEWSADVVRRSLT